MEFWVSNGIDRSNYGGENILTKRYLLYGYGITNQSVERFFQKNKVKYQIIKDTNTPCYNMDFDIMLKSPGIPFNDPFLLEVQKANKLIINDLELFSILYKEAIIIAITGTSGKTTIATLIHKLLWKKYHPHLGGNIGVPLFDLVSDRSFRKEVVIIECSSYMLANTYLFHPHIAIITNINPNHLDIHGDFKHYFTSKLKIIQQMKKDDFLICESHLSNDPLIQKFKGTKIYINEDVNQQLQVLNKNLFYQNQLIMSNFEEIFPGIHNFYNLKVAIRCAELLGITVLQIKRGLKEYVNPPYRLAKIFDSPSLVVYNDAKSSNFLALSSAIKTVSSSSLQLHWIGGGINRGEDWYQLEEVFKLIDYGYLYGNNRFLLSKVFEDSQIPFVIEKSLKEVVDKIPNDGIPKIILFSPGTPSTDQYHNYLERGQEFEQLINQKLNIGKE